MSAAFVSEDIQKPLPSPSRVEKFDKLPPPPPSHSQDVDFVPPLPPPKIVHDSNIDPPEPVGFLPPIPTLPSLGNLDHSTYIFYF